MEIVYIAIGAVVGLLIIADIAAEYELKRLRKKDEMKLKSDIAAIIHDNRHRHPKLILERVNKYLDQAKGE